MVITGIPTQITKPIEFQTPIARTQFANPSGHSYYQNYYGSGNGSSHKENNKKSIALTALTLLAFLFFLNILQNCLQEQMEMNQNNAQQVLVLSRLKTHRDADDRKDGEIGNDDNDKTINDKENVQEDESVDNQEEIGDDGKTYLKIAKRILKTEEVKK